MTPELIDKIIELYDQFPVENYDWNFPEIIPSGLVLSGKNNYELNIELKSKFKKFYFNSVSKRELQYWLIRGWGGINFQDEPRNDEKIDKFFIELNKGKLTKSTFDVISSLSKVASFLHPENYAIYDSRVIFSLNWFIFLTEEEPKFFPQPKGRGKEVSQFDLDTIFSLSGKQYSYYSHKDAYFLYNNLFKKLSNDVFLTTEKLYIFEMLLFSHLPSYVVENIRKTVRLTIIA
ncbi:hypothetical protein BST55_22555 [Vibrio vulnificus]|uniref:hypothetical protein n=1 Tax=Vibrio vulnificus TaxID=672 RepID=UPI000BA13639|nr:hypothetical protein [Vibrio vulnificus]EGR8992316.1 hypothetical protein [Vibrio vulnificus]MCU8566771.1 hypothetical protein [Vibrio vulnificus]OZS51059.1 hypothetical protein BST51_22350 [Vibrio vulnificus]OZS55625.1 hypothetical protein BST52_22635 [Vibrio vulnificus]OZS60347.1 hypothetical protein BST56_22210 [Vibrio vulnificus]